MKVEIVFDVSDEEHEGLLSSHRLQPSQKMIDFDNVIRHMQIAALHACEGVARGVRTK